MSFTTKPLQVFVSHCGGNGFHEGILFGKAILASSQWTDCHDFAQRAVDCGVGFKLEQTDPFIDVNEAKGYLQKLLSDEKYMNKAKFWSDEMKKAGGSTAGAHALVKAISAPLS
jgi:polyene glycosyltransferase